MSLKALILAALVTVVAFGGVQLTIEGEVVSTNSRETVVKNPTVLVTCSTALVPAEARKRGAKLELILANRDFAKCTIEPLRK